MLYLELNAEVLRLQSFSFLSPEYYENLCNKRKPVINKTSVSTELPSSILVFHARALLVQHCYPQKYCQVYTVMDF